MFCLNFTRRGVRAVASVTSTIAVPYSNLFHRNAKMVWSHDSSGVRYSMGDAYREWFKKFKIERISEPRESIETILSHVLAKDYRHLCHQEHPLTEEQIELLKKLCECRLARMPLQYIIGEWQFRQLNLTLSPPVFIPRPETENLVDLILERLSKRSGLVNVLEVGCGSGAISLALAHESSKVMCTAIDQCDLACSVARKNASSLNLNDRVKIWWAKLTDDGEITSCISTCKLDDELPKKFDMVVSNPPYVPNRDLFHLQPEILLYEDLKALDGGKDGLKIILPLIKFSSTVLDSSPVDGGEGVLFIEVDSSHPALLQKWFCDEENSKFQLQFKSVHLDLFGKERFVEIVKI
ncbi:MTRF1L release factor glutamine methyltransferase [Hetaerina americana]|uniref:MTRF1L release factor glutamine methyltransferase n=1 Tax=Hetaerina americana TaxID=62018 RepID=UPI003A7F5264